jgi:hypothetical protein
MPYVSVDSLKSALGIADATDDVQLLAACERATAAVDSYLASIRGGYVGFAAASNARTAAGSNTRTYSGTGHDTLFIDDADSVGTVKVDGVTIDADSYAAEPLNGKPKRYLTFILPTSSAGYGLQPATWYRGTANVTVTGYWGLAIVPNDVVETTLALAILYWRRMQLGSTKEYGPTATIVDGSYIADTEARAILSSLDGWGIPTVLGA